MDTPLDDFDLAFNQAPATTIRATWPGRERPSSYRCFWMPSTPPTGPSVFRGSGRAQTLRDSFRALHGQINVNFWRISLSAISPEVWAGGLSRPEDGRPSGAAKSDTPQGQDLICGRRSPYTLPIFQRPNLFTHPLTVEHGWRDS